MKRNTAALAALQAKLAAIENARDWGREYHRMWPEKSMIEVAREGSERFTEKDHVIAFMQGYSAARIRHEEWMMESDR